MVYLHLWKKEGILRDHCSDLAFCQGKKKVNTQEQLSGNNAFYKLKKSIAIENTTIVISYQDTKVLKICAKGLYNLDINN